MVTLNMTATCIDPWQPCGFTTAGPTADRAAVRHTRDTGHATSCAGRPIESGSTRQKGGE